jgi:hypothetical protein
MGADSAICVYNNCMQAVIKNQDWVKFAVKKQGISERNFIVFYY